MYIKIGEYVRTKTGYIGKVIIREGGYGLIYQLNINKEIQDNWINGWVHEDNIVKHSPNIIDLIEVGDYVNSEKILSISPKKDYLYACREGFEEKDIKSIVTKEQFKNVMYEV